MNHARNRPRLPSVMRHFLDSEAAGGIALMIAALFALIIANSSLAEMYFKTLHVEIGSLSLHHWINDGLMVVFFLLVGLEIKREILDGQLTTWSNRALPGIAAAGGVILPAMIFAILNLSNSETIRGWAIPSATDIAFALGVISLLGSRVPTSLKLFLATLAILDDLAAVVIIAIFYTADISIPYLGAVAVTTCVLMALNFMGVTKLTPYFAIGLVLWFFVLRSGVHATVAGVILAITIPLRLRSGKPNNGTTSPLHRLEHRLSNWVAFFIVPVFGFANAGMSFTNLNASVFSDRLILGIVLGLFLGKQLGVFIAAWLAIKFRLATRPRGANWTQLYGVALLCGIGFTMSLFIGLLSFPSEHIQNETKIAVLIGSLFSAICGWIVLRFAGRNKTIPKNIQ